MSGEAGESCKSNSSQLHPSEAEERVLSDMDIRAAQHIGRQLAVIGDELNQRYSGHFLSILLHPPPTAVRVGRPSRRSSFGFPVGARSVFGMIKRCLVSGAEAPAAQRRSRWRSWVCHLHPSHACSSWAAGVLAVILLAAAVCIEL